MLLITCFLNAGTVRLYNNQCRNAFKGLFRATYTRIPSEKKLSLVFLAAFFSRGERKTTPRLVTDGAGPGQTGALSRGGLACADGLLGPHRAAVAGTTQGFARPLQVPGCTQSRGDFI